MKAAVLYDYNHPLKVESLSLNAPGPGEVLVKIHSTGVCHSDWHVIKGDWPHVPLPTVLGHETSGVIEDIGSGVKTVQVGDHVILTWKPGCGRCEMCQLGHISVCDEVPSVKSLPVSSESGSVVNQLVGLGGFATHTVVPEWAAVSVDRDVPFPQKALVGCAVTTGVGSVINTAKVQQGSTVSVFGCGGVGLSCIQGAKIAGADKIIAVDIKENKLDMAIEFGATHTVNSQNIDPVEKIRELSDGLGTHYSFEAIGVVEKTLVQSVECTRKKGVTVWVGAPPVGLDVTLDSRSLVFEKSILGSYIGSARPHIDFPKMLKLYKNGMLKLDEMLSQSHPIEDINLAFDAMKRGEVARSVITFE